MMRFNQGIPYHLSIGKQRKLQNLRTHKRKGSDFHERRLHKYKPRKQIQADRGNAKGKFKSSEKLQKASQKLLMQTMNELNIQVKGKKLFAAVLKAQLGKRFYREKRRDKLRILATGCAVYHELASQLNPKKALEQLAASVGLNTEQISDPCRVIVESLIDYGGSKDEKTANRQYAARDARALSYIVRKGMDPSEVAKPAKGETLTKWAEREAEYRLAQRPAAKPAQKAPVAAVLAPKAPNQLAVVQLAQGLYSALTALLEPGVVVVGPKAGGKALALAVAPLKGLTVDQAEAEPYKVQRAIRKAMKKALGKTVEKSSKPPASTKSLKSPEALATRSAKKADPPTRPLRESGDVFSTHKALTKSGAASSNPSPISKMPSIDTSRPTTEPQSRFNGPPRLRPSSRSSPKSMNLPNESVH